MRVRRRVTLRPTIQYRPQSNSLTERWNQEVLSGVRVLLVASGFSREWWSYAMRFWTTAYNIQPHPKLPENTSPIEARHPDFDMDKASIAPFGSAVVYRPNPE